MGLPHALAAALVIGIVSCGHDAHDQAAQPADWPRARAEMVATQLRNRDIVDARVLAAMERVERHRFVPETERGDAYGDYPVPIGYGQTISQPYIVAFMTQAVNVQPNHRVLEIGTGSGYQAAVLAELAQDVYTIEIVPELGTRARMTLETLGYKNVHVRIGNGYLGWPEHAPYDRIIVTAAPDDIPPALIEQLRVGGLMAIPVGSVEQELRILRRRDRGLETISTLPVRFVPMVGKPK
ncbi:MAG TPA: protein-L-isoaspartate(D-aspartate) O-methyltransferase [Vicinamibacterales bacterium]|nr:protein-L-isoaspartate(D-aspartate) O-methyltransferase [Vicinamibacterales bacterium]